MAKLIRKHFGKVVSVEPTAPSDIDRKWSWHKAYEGFYGIIHVYQSRHRFPGKYFTLIISVWLMVALWKNGHRASVLLLVPFIVYLLFQLFICFLWYSLAYGEWKN